MKNINSKAILFTLCLFIFIDSISAGIIFPIMPELFLNAQYGLVSSSSFLSPQMLYGLAFALFPLAGFFGMPIIGSLSDYYGRKNLMIIGIFGICLSDVISCISIFNHSVYLFLLSRLIMGFCAGAFVVGNAIIADISGDEKSGMNNFRWPMIASISGFVLGPLIGSSGALVEGSSSLMLPFLVALLLGWLNLYMLYKYLPNTLNKKSKELFSVWKVFKSMYSVLNSKLLIALSISYILFQFCIGLFIQSISLYLAQSFDYSTGNIGLFFTFMCVGVALSSMVIQPILLKFMEVKSIVSISVLIVSLMLLIQGVNELQTIDASLGFVIITSFILYLFLPLAGTGYTSIYSNLSSYKSKGSVMGLMGQMYSVTWFMGGILIGYMVEADEAMMMFIASGLGFISFLICFFIKRFV
ncbi:MAG: DHA1 family tetracycline resistance protein-like MFS transporter [Francisella sp.]